MYAVQGEERNLADQMQRRKMRKTSLFAEITRWNFLREKALTLVTKCLMYDLLAAMTASMRQKEGNDSCGLGFLDLDDHGLGGGE